MRLLLFALALLFVGCMAPHPIEGTWEGKDAQGHEAILYIRSEGQFEGMAKGESVKGTWKLNEEVEPQQITMNFEGGQPFVTIIKIQGDKMLIQPVTEEGKLPAAFSEKATVYVRKK